MARTDIHRPSVIVPADYDFVAFECVKIEDIGDAMFLKANRDRIREHMAATGGDYSRHEHGGNCHICGSVNAIYTVLFHHRPTNTYVRTGTECAEKLDYDSGAGEAFRKHVKDAREAVAGKRKAQALLTAPDLVKAWDIFNADHSEGREEGIIRDIVGKLVRYGSISEAQTNFLRKLVQDVETRAERAAARAIEKEAAQPVPVLQERVVVTGTVVGFYATDWGTNMVVQHADGWTVAGTPPRGLDAKKGDKVRFAAQVVPSRNDPKKGYFKRPTKPEII